MAFQTTSKHLGLFTPRLNVASCKLLLRRSAHCLSQAKSKGLFGKKYDAVVIGGGHNGLIAAAYLQQKGHSTLVLERRHVLGGAAVTEEIVPGFKFSRASYLLSLLRPHIIKDLKLKSHGLKLHLRNPSNFTPILGRAPGQVEPSSLLLGANMEFNKMQIAKFSKKDAEAYPLYEKLVSKVAGAMEYLIDSEPPNFSPEMKKSKIWETITDIGQSAVPLLRAGYGLNRDFPLAYEMITAPASKILDRWFESDPLKATLATDAVIGAMLSPRTPGSGYVLLHHVMGGVDDVSGAWAYPQGGMGAVSQAIAAAAETAGATIVTDAPVKRICTDMSVKGKRLVAAVVLEDDTIVASDCVLSNATAKVTFEDLVLSDDLPKEFLSEVSSIDYTSPVTKINVALSGLPQFSSVDYSSSQPGPHHSTTIHLNSETMDMLHTAYLQAAEQGVPSQRPMIEMCLPSALDPTLAPEGCHVASLFVQYTPYHLQNGQEWTEEYRKQFAERVFDSIGEYAPGFRSLVVDYECLPPPEIERIFGLTGGNIFQGSMSLDQLYFARPVPFKSGYCTPISGLYLCGSAAHPGGGVMGAPGYQASKVVCKDLKALQKKAEKSQK